MWVTISDTEIQRPGETYKAVMSVNMAYPAFVSVLRTEFQFQSTLNRDFTILEFGDAPPLWDAHAGKYGPFSFWFTYQVNPKGKNVSEAGLDPWVILALLAAVVGAIVATALAGKHIEKLVAGVGTSVDTLVSDTAPALSAIGILVVLGLFIVFTRGR